MKHVIVFLSLMVWSLTSVAAGLGTCPADTINPISQVNWNNAFPIVIGGVPAGAAKGPAQPSKMREPTICMCPGRDIYHKIGIGLTYWQPAFLAEVQNNAGCLTSLGGKDMSMPPVAGVMPTDSGGLVTSNGAAQSATPRMMQVHWMKYPLFSMMDIFNTMACENSGGAFAIAGMTETNPFWKDPFWTDIIYPETFLFANPIAIAACIPDAIASTVNVPIDALTWCSGSQGTLYPLTGSATNASVQSIAAGNLLILAKYMQGLSRKFLLQQTIGKRALCHASYNPNLVRSQFRIDPIFPTHTDKFVRFGKIGTFWAAFPSLNPGRRYDSTFLIWQGQQCCAM